MKTFFLDAKKFLVNTYQDQRIPEHDKKVFLVLAMALLLRILFIPDWIPYLGPLDALIMLGLLADYLANVLDQNLLLSHYSWGMKSFARLRRVAQFFSLFAPGFISDRLWQYTKDPF